MQLLGIHVCMLIYSLLRTYSELKVCVYYDYDKVKIVCVYIAEGQLVRL